MNKLLPRFKSIIKSHYTYDEDTDVGMVRFVAPDLGSGDKDKFNVIELNLYFGTAVCIGRELPKKHAKRIAKLGLQEYYKQKLISAKGRVF